MSKKKLRCDQCEEHTKFESHGYKCVVIYCKKYDTNRAAGSFCKDLEESLDSEYKGLVARGNIGVKS